jgi:hypothetical protein
MTHSTLNAAVLVLLGVVILAALTWLDFSLLHEFVRVWEGGR